MRITVRRLRRLEVWSDLAVAGGVRRLVLAEPIALTLDAKVEGDHALDFTVPLASDPTGLLVEDAIVRVDQDDATYDEWVVAKVERSAVGGAIKVSCHPVSVILQRRANLLSQIDGAGVVRFDLELIGLTPTQIIDTFVLPACANALPYVARGTVDSTEPVDLTVSWESPLQVLKRLADTAGVEFQLRRSGAQYLIDLVTQIGAGGPTADVRVRKNLLELVQRREGVQQVTRLYPRGADVDGIHATIARATWKIGNLQSGTDVYLYDPVTGLPPAWYDFQLNGYVLRRPDGTLTGAITNTNASGLVRIPSTAGLAIGDLVEFRKADGGELTYLETSDGPKAVAKFDAPDIPGTLNVIPNPFGRDWPAGNLPSGWTVVGAPTLTKQVAAPYTALAGASIRVQAAAAGQGVQSPAGRVFPTAAGPYGSGYARLWVVSGQVKVELVLTKADTSTVVVPAAPGVASNTLLGTWEDLGVSNEDLYKLGATKVAVRIVSIAGPAEFYVDAVQATEGIGQQPLVEGAGPTQLWLRANEELRTRGGPAVAYELPFVDLEALDGTTYAAEALELGASVRVTEDRIPVAITTRIIGIGRDYLHPGSSKLTLSTRADDLTGTLARPAKPPRVPAVTSGTGTTTPTGASTPIAAPAITLGYETEDVGWFPTPILLVSFTPPAVAGFRGVLLKVRRNGATYASVPPTASSPVRVAASWNTVYDVQCWALNDAGVVSDTPTTAQITMIQGHVMRRDLPRVAPDGTTPDGYDTKASDTSGLRIDGAVGDSTNLAVNRTLKKINPGDPNDTDGITQGTTRRIPLATALDGSYRIDFAGSGFVNKHLDNVSDGTTFRRTTLDEKTGGARGFAALDAGNVVVTTALDFARGYTNKHAGNLPRSVGGVATSTVLGNITDAGHAGSAMQDSTGLAVNRALKKLNPGDPNDSDGVTQGTTRRIPLATALNGSYQIDFVSPGVVNRRADVIARSAGDGTAISTIVQQLDNAGEVKAAGLGRGKVYTAGTKPSIVLARISAQDASAQGGAATATQGRLAALGYSVTRSIAATVAQCRAFDVVLIDCTAWSADEHNQFIRDLLADGQRVLVAGNDSTTGLFYVTASAARAGGSQFTKTTRPHPMHQGWAGSFTDGDGGTVITGYLDRCTPILDYAGGIGTCALELHDPKGGVLLHVQSLGAFADDATANSDQLLVNCVEYLGGGLLRQFEGSKAAAHVLDTDGVRTDASIAGANALELARRGHGVFLETFENAIDTTWTQWLGSGVESIVAGAGVAGGKVYQAVGARGRYFPYKLPFDPSKLYRLRVRVRRTVAATDPTQEKFYCGVIAFLADGVTPINTIGTNTTSAQHYVAASGADLNAKAIGEWVEYTGWFKGHGTTGFVSQNSPLTASPLYTGAAYFQPGFLINYATGNGTAQLDYIAIDVFDEAAQQRLYSALDDVGNLRSGVWQSDGVALRQITKGHWQGQARHGDNIVFPTSFQDVPVVLFRGGLFSEPRNRWGATGNGAELGAFDTTKPVYDDTQPLDLTAAGFQLRARLAQRGLPVVVADQFPNTTVTIEGATVEVTLSAAPAADDTYTVRFRLTLTCNATVLSATTAATIAVDTNDGGGWFERGSKSYSVSDTNADGTPISQTWTNEFITFTVAGLGVGDLVRLRVKSLTFNRGTGTLSMRGLRGSSNGDPGDGVKYTTNSSLQYATRTPESSDFITIDVFSA
jgi:hypothetical protein